MKAAAALARTPGRDRQASLISSAASLFAAKGFKGTTTKEIAKAAGVSEALVFKYFPTKRALYAAILAEKAPLSELLNAVEDVARKRDDHRVFTLIAGYRIRPGADPTMLRLLLFHAFEGPDPGFDLGSGDTQFVRHRRSDHGVFNVVTTHDLQIAEFKERVPE